MPGILLTNARSLLHKLDEFCLTLSLNKIDIAAVTESWFSADLPEEVTSVDGYNLYRKDRRNRRGGGIALYISNDIKAKLVDIAVPDNLECIWTQLQPQRTPRDVPVLYMGVLYHPPWANEKLLQDETIQHLIHTLDTIRRKHPLAGIILCGDFNNLPIQPLLSSHPELKQVVTGATRANSTLDLIITNVHHQYHVPDIIAPLGSSDHNCILWKPKVSNQHSGLLPRIKHRLVTQERKEALGLCMCITDWSAVYNAVSVEDKVATFNRILQTMLDVCVPLRTSKSRNVDKHWMTDKIMAAIKKRQSAYKKHGKTEKWKKLRNWVQTLIRKQKSSHYNRCIGMLKKENPREWWNFVNNELGRTQKSKGKVTVSDVPDDRVADALNDFFAEAWSDSRAYSLFPLQLPSNSDDLCSIGQVKAILRSLNTRKSGGPDGIPNWVLSVYHEDLAPVVTHLINSSYNSGYMPSVWKMANVCPIPKTSVPASKKDWRPISLISTLGKVQERLVLNRFLPIMKPWIRDQYAYMPKASTTVALLKVYQSWLQSLDTKKTSMVRVLLADMSKAFDRVDHGILLQHLDARGTPPRMLAWISSYLSSRTQRVVANNQYSSWRVVTSGVPQGGVLSPYLFLVYMSTRTTKHETTDNTGYADDIGLSRTIPCDAVETDDTMQQEATQLDSWAADKNMIMNGDKSYELRLCFSKHPPEPPPLTLGGKVVPVVDCATYLGFKVHSNLRWDSHITHVTTKGSKRLHFLRLLAKGDMPPKDLLTVYTTLVRPVLEYAHVVFVGCTESQRNTLERVQKRALRIIYGHSSNPASLAPLPTLQSRRENAARSLYTQMLASDHPLHFMVPDDMEVATGRTLRNSSHRTLPKCRTERLKRSFLYRATVLHNNSF
ncbi:uncharacterized protein LOC118415630 [Branchiostoma floridae]|uniref:Uncharacterized protein LOC118415630 n=1 Tax=Branchiostoma floridae TaxID=7739 RepID=A0A9J7MRC5_BRAFL|nr:uncharacterized protein LOC118415630 [Branchiostoma floridae]